MNIYFCNEDSTKNEEFGLAVCLSAGFTVNICHVRVGRFQQHLGLRESICCSVPVQHSTRSPSPASHDDHILDPGQSHTLSHKFCSVSIRSIFIQVKYTKKIIHPPSKRW